MSKRRPPKRTPLQTYLDDNNMTLAVLADRVGVGVPMLSLVSRGLRQPSLDVAFRLQQETGIPAETFARRTA